MIIYSGNGEGGAHEHTKEGYKGWDNDNNVVSGITLIIHREAIARQKRTSG
jgi:hypothetical protein